MSKSLQQFEYGTVKRSQIKFADYNPRIIDESNQKKLVKAIRENGLIEPLVWNKRTGVLVGGHQRLTAADKIYRKKDYDVPVAIIDVDEKTEKKLNVQLNNPSMQGDWDLDELFNLSQDVSFEDMGFNKSDIDFMFDGDVDFDGSLSNSDEHQRHQRLTMKKLKMKKIRWLILLNLTKLRASSGRKIMTQPLLTSIPRLSFQIMKLKKSFIKRLIFQLMRNTSRLNN